MVKRKVIKVIDGDTIKVDKSVKGSNYIRMTKVNAPEKGQYGYKSATKKLKEQVQGKTVNVVSRGKSYGRTVADVTKNGKKIKSKYSF
jgi:endonuclease YncB( thermonuclease family)